MTATIGRPRTPVLDGWEPVAEARRSRAGSPGRSRGRKRWLRPRPDSRHPHSFGEVTTQMKVRPAAGGGVGGPPAAPAAAHASGIAVQGACFVTGAPVSITGFGFTAGAP